MRYNHQITSFLICLTTQLLVTTSSTPLPTIETLGPITALDYAQHPNEVLPMQPLLLYPMPRNLQLQGRELDDDDNEIIYVKLLKRKAYRPAKLHPNDLDDESNGPRELTMNDIFYVKALTNGQFSHQRLKVYRLPEFYAISVFRKGAKL
ncbi:uncharacterized protein LOC105212347 [Zeugodacus cucurbitae]|uniref:Serine/threonine-protein kinase tel1 n=1 Tax=Zeugodacus cucurbitae TaxID=28588 RepID=A0A0A1WHS1_ZEUCU|nr:uncharacterized protein LOC105212347 [Zeugodacus cucurbitae]